MWQDFHPPSLRTANNGTLFYVGIMYKYTVVAEMLMTFVVYGIVFTLQNSI